MSEARREDAAGCATSPGASARGCPQPPGKHHPCAPCAPAAGASAHTPKPRHVPSARARLGHARGQQRKASGGRRRAERTFRRYSAGVGPGPDVRLRGQPPSSGWRRRHGLCFPVSRRASARRCHGDCCGSTGRATRRHRSTCTASRKVPSQALRARRFWSLQDFRSLSPGKDVRERPKIQKTPNQGSGFWFLGNRSPGGLLTTKGQTQMKITRGNYDGAKAAHARLSNETPKEKGQK
jgi:hypothetical protein